MLFQPLNDGEGEEVPSPSGFTRDFFSPLWLAAALTMIFMVIGSAGCIGPSQAGPRPGGNADIADIKVPMPASVTAGKVSFEKHCVSCHGGRGDRMPVAPLNSKEFLETRGDATLVAVISEGKGSMPAWGEKRGGPLVDTQVQQIVAYLNFAVGRQSYSVLAGSGQTLYASSCASCHGEKGDRIPVAPLNVKGFLDGRSDDALARAIADGTGQMPGNSLAKGGKLSDEQIRSITSYLRYTGEQVVAERAARGRQLYLSSCLACHGEKGDRISSVSLASHEFLSGLGDGKIIRSVGDGGKTMPGFGRGGGGAYDASDLAAILAYLKTWSGTNAASALTGAVQDGAAKDLFAKNCVPCHGDGGDKVAGVQLFSKSFLQQRKDESLIQTISRGNAKGMPAWAKASGGPLGDDQISGLVAFLKSTAAAGAGPAPSERPDPKPQASETAVTPASKAPPAPVSGVDPAIAAKGKAVFAQKCVACHGETRDKIPTCKLTDKAWVQEKGEAGLIKSITNGKGGMPAWGAQLTVDEIKAAANYLLDAVNPGAAPAPSAVTAPASSAGAEADSQMIAKGKETFGKNCVACHGETRDKIPTCKLTDKAWVQEKGEAGLIKSITNGKGGMPAWSAQLSVDEIKAAANYLLDAVGLGAAPPPSAAIAPTSSAGAAADSQMIAKGKETFGKNCVACHGETRDKIPTCKLTDKAWVQEKGEAGLIKSITNGKGGMPAWSAQLSVDEIKAAANYLLDAAGLGAAPPPSAAIAPASSAGAAADSKMIAKGKETFGKNCVACHGETRDKIPTCKLTDKAWVQEKGEAGLIKSITNGKGGMPAWSAQLSVDEIKAAANYLLDAVGAAGSSSGAASSSTPASSTASALGGAGAETPSLTLVSDVQVTGVAALGKELYAKNCLMCHGADGLGQKACPLGRKDYLENMSQEGLRTRITFGKPGAGMPTWGKSRGGPLGDDEISAIMAYLPANAR